MAIAVSAAEFQIDTSHASTGRLASYPSGDLEQHNAYAVLKPALAALSETVADSRKPPILGGWQGILFPLHWVYPTKFGILTR